MPAFVNRMTEVQVNDLITLAKGLQLNAENSKDRDTAVMAYAVQQSCSELLNLREEHAAAMNTINALMEILGTSDTLSISGQVSALKAELDALAAENAGLKNTFGPGDAVLNFLTIALRHTTYDQIDLDDVTLAFRMSLPETPATDHFIAEVKAQGVEEFVRMADYSESVVDGEIIVTSNSVFEAGHEFAQQLRGEKA